jgi:aspartyl protease family protein
MRPLPFILTGVLAGFPAAPALASPDGGIGSTGRLIYLLILLGVLLFWWGSSRLSWGQVGRDLKYLAIWGAIMLGLVALYGLRDDFAYVWRSMMAELRPDHAVTTGEAEVMLAAGADGHFRVQTEVNGVPIRMIVDTGASDVALARKDARAAGIDVDALTYDRPYVTANGVAYAAAVTLDSVRIGGIELRNVQASVGNEGMSVSLLGMSFLNRLSAVEMSPSRLVLRQ